MQDSEIVYHYTSAATLLKIVESSSIWASNLQYLNDVTEAIHCVNMMRQRLDGYLAKTKCRFSSVLKAAILDVTFDAWNSPYVASFSAHRDSLPQWRSYCSSGNGVSIGFRAEALRRSVLSDKTWLNKVPPMTSTLGRVQYLENSDWNRTDALLDSCVGQLEGWRKYQDSLPPDERGRVDDNSFLQFQIMQPASLVKHSSFSSEMEFRLIAPDPFFTGQELMAFRATRTTVVPYLAVLMPEWGKSRNGPTKYPTTYNDFFLREVIVGPTRNPELTSTALKMLFERKNVPVTVSNSEVPYRDI
jgi:hypothetical protein